jgi:hypothetical protein
MVKVEKGWVEQEFVLLIIAALPSEAGLLQDIMHAMTCQCMFAISLYVCLYTIIFKGKIYYIFAIEKLMTSFYYKF